MDIENVHHNDLLCDSENITEKTEIVENYLAVRDVTQNIEVTARVTWYSICTFYNAKFIKIIFWLNI